MLEILICAVAFLAGGSVQAGESVTGTIDFGPDGVGGYPEVEIEVSKSPAVVRLAYATHPDGLGAYGDFRHETRATYLGPDVWLPILPANTDRFDVFAATNSGLYRASLAQGLVRYVKWTVESGRATVKNIRFLNDGIHSEEKRVGGFKCSDERLNELWSISLRTCELAAIPERKCPIAVSSPRTNALLGASYAYLSDGAKRDRLVWSGDLWWAQRNMYFGFSPDSPFMAGSIRMLGENQLPNGYVQACPYPESHGVSCPEDYGPFASDEFAAWFVPVVRDHWLYTADRATTEAAFPKVAGLLAYLAANQGPDGIFIQRKATCKHAAGLTFGASSLHRRSYMNILLWKTYRDAAELAVAFGSAEQVRDWREKAEKLKRAVHETFWDEANGFFLLSAEDRRYAPEANPLALAVGFASGDEARRIVEKLSRHWHGKFQALAIRGCFEYGYAEKAMALLGDHNWYNLLADDWQGLKTTQECMNLDVSGWGDEAHPDTAIAGILSNYILGVEPLEPGFRRFRVNPRAVPSITSAKGTVPTPFGNLAVEWKRVDGEVRVSCRGPSQCVRETETERLQHLIDDAAKSGGGRVEVCPGVHVVGTLYLKDGVELNLSEGAVLRATTNRVDYNELDAYPENFGSIAENWDGRHLIVARGAENVSLTGSGTIDGNGEKFFERRVWPVSAYGHRRNARGDEFTHDVETSAWSEGIRWSKRWSEPRPGPMLAFVKCRNVRIENVTLRNSSCWNLLCHGCDNVRVGGISVFSSASGANTDGMDIDCCSDVLIEGCDIDVGDDGIAVRGSQRRLGVRKPCERIVIRNCNVASHSDAFRFGVGTGLVRDVLVEDCRIWRAAHAYGLCCSYGNVGGCDIEDVTLRNVVAEGCASECERTPLGPENRFGIRNIKVENCEFDRSPADYRVIVLGKEIPVQKFRQSKISDNMKGERDCIRISQTDESAFASMTSGAPVVISIDLPAWAVDEEVEICSADGRLDFCRNGERVTFTAPCPGWYVLCCCQIVRNPLVLFVNRKADWHERWTRTFGPGSHFVGTVRLASHERVFLDERAILHGTFVIDDAEDVQVLGYGTIDSGCYDLSAGRDCASNISLNRSSNVVIDGPFLIDAAGSAIAADHCEGIALKNIKSVGQWRGDCKDVKLVNCENTVVSGSFFWNDVVRSLALDGLK